MIKTLVGALALAGALGGAATPSASAETPSSTTASSSTTSSAAGEVETVRRTFAGSVRVSAGSSVEAAKFNAHTRATWYLQDHVRKPKVLSCREIKTDYDIFKTSTQLYVTAFLRAECREEVSGS